jgi:hypothetical protein
MKHRSLWLLITSWACASVSAAERPPDVLVGACVATIEPHTDDAGRSQWFLSADRDPNTQRGGDYVTVTLIARIQRANELGGTRTTFVTRSLPLRHEDITYLEPDTISLNVSKCELFATALQPSQLGRCVASVEQTRSRPGLPKWYINVDRAPSDPRFVAGAFVAQVDITERVLMTNQTIDDRPYGVIVPPPQTRAEVAQPDEIVTGVRLWKCTAYEPRP